MENLSYNNVYSTYHNEVLNMITYKIGQKNKELAEELTNDVFVRVHKHFTEYDSSKSNFKTWLYNIANNIIIDQWRKKKLETTAIESKVDSDGNEFFQVESNSLTPHQIVVNNELGKTIHSAISSLPEIYKILSHKFFIEQCTYDEIVKDTNLGIGTVKGRLSRARKLLQAILS